jgi:hypothetical protein
MCRRGYRRECLAVYLITAQTNRLGHRIVVVPYIGALDFYGLKPVVIQELPGHLARGPTTCKVLPVVLIEHMANP